MPRARPADAARCCQMQATITAATVAAPTRRPTGVSELLGAWYGGGVTPFCASCQSMRNWWPADRNWSAFTRWRTRLTRKYTAGIATAKRATGTMRCSASTRCAVLCVLSRSDATAQGATWGGRPLVRRRARPRRRWRLLGEHGGLRPGVAVPPALTGAAGGIGVPARRRAGIAAVLAHPPILPKPRDHPVPASRRPAADLRGGWARGHRSSYW